MKQLFSFYLKGITTLTISLFMLLFAATKTNAQWIELGGTNGSPFDGGLSSIATDAGGNVYAGGYFYDTTYHDYIFKWNGTAWSELGGAPINNHINSIATDADGNVYAFGYFYDTTYHNYVAKWNGTAWSKLGGNSSPFNLQIYSIATDAGGNVYAGGDFYDTTIHNYIAKWNGTAWSELVLDSSPFNGYIIQSIATDADGNVYAGGYFTDTTTYHNYIAKWNGTAWSELGGTNGSRFNGSTFSIATDAGGNVYAGGDFTDSNGHYYVAEWNGTAWSELGGTNGSRFNGSILSIATDADGNVYAGGDFTDSNGHYYVAEYAQSGNTPITVNIVNPNPAMIQDDGSLNSDQSKINLNATVMGAATDGVTELLLVADATVPITFSLSNPKDGFLNSLDKQTPSTSPISITPNNGKAVCVYKVPDGYGANNLNSGRNIIVNAYYTSDNSHKTDITIKLVTPPVVLVHGMWSDPSVWQTGGFVNSLINAGYSYIPNNLVSIYLVDYSGAPLNATTFDPYSNESIEPRKRVQNKINEALESYHSQHIAVAQVDVVAHSLGGLMTRSLSQDTAVFKNNRNYLKGYVHKLITLGTPHRGSPFGAELYRVKDSWSYIRTSLTGIIIPYKLSAILAWKNMPIGSCHRDFAIDSKGIADLGTTLPYKTFAITASYASNGGISEETAGYYAMNGLCLFAFGKTLNQVMESRCLTSVLPNDSIVPYASQTGYIDKTQLFYGTSHSIILIPGSNTETNNPLIQQKVTDLLLSDDTTLFSAGFTAPNSHPIESCDNPAEVIGTSNPKKKETSNNLGGSPAPTGNEYVQISSPVRGSSYRQNIDTTVTLSFEAFGGAMPTNALFLVGNNGWYNVPTTPPYSVTVNLPQNITPGALTIALLVNDTTGIRLSDTSHINILPNGTLDSIFVTPASIRLDSSIRQSKLLVKGEYTSMNDTQTIDIGSSSAGTIYTTQKNSSVVSVSADGVVTAVSAGVDTVIVSNSDKTFKVLVTVDSNILYRSFYSNTIDFTDIPDKTTSDDPFALEAIATSGSTINFTLISGPVEIINGVVFIKGAGTVTIQATCGGDAYFDSAAPVTKTFYITGILPLQLLTFTGSLVSNTVLLNWTTANEVNTSNYIVERSIDGIRFTDIGNVNAVSNTSGAGNYYFKDESVDILAASPVYYRLKEVDKDGKQTLSNTIPITLTNVKKSVVYPNPAKRMIHLLLNQSLAGDSYLKMYDMTGKEVMNHKLTNLLSQQIYLPAMSNGNYKIIVWSGGKIVLQQTLFVSM